jgi:uncharacterized protein
VGAPFEGPVTGSITLVNAAASISARGALHARVICECSRCLAPHGIDLDLEVNELCAFEQIEDTSITIDEEQRIPILDGDVVDLTELVRQVLAVSVPPRSLCTPDCKGLCPQCGRNLNAGSCGCDAKTPDTRWADLADLLDE